MGIPIVAHNDYEALYELIKGDKKNEGKRINFYPD